MPQAACFCTAVPCVCTALPLCAQQCPVYARHCLKLRMCWHPGVTLCPTRRQFCGMSALAVPCVKTQRCLNLQLCLHPGFTLYRSRRPHTAPRAFGVGSARCTQSTNSICKFAGIRGHPGVAPRPQASWISASVSRTERIHTLLWTYGVTAAALASTICCICVIADPAHFIAIVALQNQSPCSLLYLCQHRSAIPSGLSRHGQNCLGAQDLLSALSVASQIAHNSRESHIAAPLLSASYVSAHIADGSPDEPKIAASIASVSTRIAQIPSGLLHRGLSPHCQCLSCATPRSHTNSFGSIASWLQPRCS